MVRSEVVRGEWRGDFSGRGRVESGDFACGIAAPAAIGGSGDGVSPSSLLVAAASGCFLLTLAGVLHRRRLKVASITLETEGVYSGTAPPELRAVIHRPRVVVAREHAARLGAVTACFEVAKVSCLATRAMPGVAFSIDGATAVEEQ
jgi:peroxiredoxin-like protein